MSSALRRPLAVSDGDDADVDGGSADGLYARASDAITAHFEPPRTWRYSRALELRPVLLVAFIALSVVLGFLVYTNYSSETCSEQLVYDNWSDDPLMSSTAGASCSILDSATGDWTQFINVLTQWNFTQQMIGPTLQSRSLVRGRSWTPKVDECANTVPTAYPYVNLSLTYEAYMQRYRLAIVAAVSWQPDISIILWAVVPSKWNSDLQAGFVEFAVPSAEKYRRDGNSTNVSYLRTSFTHPRYRDSAVRIFFQMLPSQLSEVMFRACVEFISSKHIQRCHVCIGDSVATISWIIVIGFAQAVSGVHLLAAAWIHRCNKDKQLVNAAAKGDSGRLDEVLLPASGP